MPNKEQLHILNQGVAEWNQWREDNPNTKIDLAESNFANIVLTGVNLVNANLEKANLTGTVLLGANLVEANLRRALLTQAILVGANLTQAKLIGADLIGANLNGADLTKVDLSGANLTEAVLKETNLSGASLSETDLTGADLTGADFTDSRFLVTKLGSNDLSSSIGLESINHWTSSIIDVHTIKKSKGKIPIKFLRGCGLNDIDIEYAKLAMPGLDSEQVAQITYEIHRLYCDQPVQFYSCFISYSSKDHGFAQRLHADLQNNGVRCWFAPEDMKIGDEFRRAIGQQIRLRDKLLIILSKNSIGSEWVGDEVEKALAEEKQQGALKLFPIRLDDAVLVAKDDWAEKIRLRRHIGDFTNDYTKAFQRLLRDLKQQ